MKLITSLKDTEYPLGRITKTRIASRAVVLNNDNKIALTHIVATDKFGERNYYELPGGGKKLGETCLDAAFREAEEELGYKTKLQTKLGIVHDFYNLIEQENFSYYYLLKTVKKVPNHYEERESRLIARIIWVTLEEAQKLYLNQLKQTGVALLVARRELPILKLVTKVLTTQ
ncbi:MAG TPA: NUDIX hydrolase [Bacilli bacterium]|nr:NUDIX hydrolase [Bacilli bacterium]